MVVGRKRSRRRYSSGDEALDAKIAELVEAASVSDNSDLLTEMLTSCLRVARDRSHRGEMKLVNAALKEFAYAFKVFRAYRGIRKVSVFGSSRSTAEAPDYECARRFAATMAGRGWMVITGAGPGIMQAGHQGAGAERSFGANIRLPMEVEPNVVIEGDPKLINFKYFFTRKVTFLKESDAFALFPGGFGTLDETFELLTLMQTGKSDLHPVVLLEAEGGRYWQDWRRFISEHLIKAGLISSEDLDLVHMTDSIESAVAEIEGFYRNYHSQRYVDGVLVLRLQRLPDERTVARLSDEFADILRSGTLRAVEPSREEIKEADFPELPRLALDFDQRSHGRLRRLIDALNGY
jgi:uncharacterized protein (TIGR00730 family)